MAYEEHLAIAYVYLGAVYINENFNGFDLNKSIAYSKEALTKGAWYERPRLLILSTEDILKNEGEESLTKKYNEELKHYISDFLENYQDIFIEVDDNTTEIEIAISSNSIGGLSMFLNLFREHVNLEHSVFSAPAFIDALNIVKDYLNERVNLLSSIGGDDEAISYLVSIIQEIESFQENIIKVMK